MLNGAQHNIVHCSDILLSSCLPLKKFSLSSSKCHQRDGKVYIMQGTHFYNTGSKVKFKKKIDSHIACFFLLFLFLL